MNYYSVPNKLVLTEVSLRSLGLNEDLNLLAAVQIFPIYYEPVSHDAVTQYLAAKGSLLWNEHKQNFIQPMQIVNMPLEQVKSNVAKIFKKVFFQLDSKRARSTSTVAEALATSFDVPDDIGILGQLNMVVEENQVLYRNLQAATTWEEASKIRPWIPESLGLDKLD